MLIDTVLCMLAFIGGAVIFYYRGKVAGYREGKKEK